MSLLAAKNGRAIANYKKTTRDAPARGLDTSPRRGIIFAVLRIANTASVP